MDITWIVIIGINVVVLWVLFIMVILQKIKFKILEKNMISNVQKILNKGENTMNEDLKKLGKILINRIEEAKEEVLDKIDNLVVEEEDDDELDDNEDELDSEFEDEDAAEELEDVKDYEGDRKVTSEPPKPPEEKKGLWGRKKKVKAKK